jgi:2-hydroxychromene-2-carboxylate isomerase
LPARSQTKRGAARSCGAFVRRVFVANFGEDREIGEREVVAAILAELGQPADAVLERALQPGLRERLRTNTERAIALDIFGAPNCLAGGELFWGEETLEDAVAWAVRVTA